MHFKSAEPGQSDVHAALLLLSDTPVADLSFVQDDTLVACVLNQLDCMCNSYVGIVTMRRAAGQGLISTSLVSGMLEAHLLDAGSTRDVHTSACPAATVDGNLAAAGGDV